MNKTETTAKILIAEDELIVANHIKSQLEKAGYQVAGTVAKGEDAVTQAEKLQPDLALMDIRLAGKMDGIQAAQKIHQQFNIPIIYLTAFADKDTLERARITEPFGYLLKPFEARILHSTIEVALYKHRMEQKLKDSEQRFRVLAETAPVGIFQTDPGGACTFVNDRYCSITGLTPQEALGRNWEPYIHPEDRERVMELLAKLGQTGETFSAEFRNQRPDGNVVRIFAQAEPLSDETGSQTGYIGTINDITELKQLEERVLTGQKLESLGILAGGIAHDFNNLLSVIMGNISLLREDIPEDEFCYKMLDQAEYAAAEAAELAHKLITFSKGGWLIKRPITLQKITAPAIRRITAQTGISCASDIPGGLLQVNGDENQLNQVLLNLLQNAAEAMTAAGKVQGMIIKAENHELTDEGPNQLKAGPYVRVTVEDNGAGIDPAHLGRVFDPYFTTKEMGSQKGMGLGLAICYSIIAKHQGSIKIDSTPGQGAVVELLLPAVPAPAAATDTMARKIKHRLMVVDDDHNILQITRRLLEKMGYDVDTFNSGGEALKAYKQAMENNTQQPYGLVILDIIFKTGLDGRETLKYIQEVDPGAVVVGITGFLDTEDAEALKKDGFVEVMLKPFNKSDLQEVLKTYLNAAS